MLGSTVAAPRAPALASTLTSTRRSRPLTPRTVQTGLWSPAGSLALSMIVAHRRPRRHQEVLFVRLPLFFPPLL